MGPTGRRLLGIVLPAAALVGGLWLVAGSDPETMRDVRGGAGRTASVPEAALGSDADPELGLEDAPGAVGPAPAGLTGTGAVDAHGPVTVRVTAADGEPISGIFVSGPTDGLVQWVKADFDGVAHFDDLPYDGSVFVHVLVPRKDGIPTSIGDRRPVRGPDVELHVKRAVQLVVHFKDVLTGRLVEPDAATLYVRGGPALPPQINLEDGVRRQLVDVATDGRIEVRVQVDPPKGYAMAAETAYRAVRSPYASQIDLDVPLLRELPLIVLLRDHTGTVSSEAVVDQVNAAGRLIEDPAFETDAFGNRRILGVPFFERERIRVRATIPGTDAYASASAWMSMDPDAVATLTIDLPEPTPFEGPRDNGAIGIGGSGGGAFRGRGGKRGPLPQGKLAVVVRRFNGEPAVGAKVIVAGQVEHTSDRGVARFMHLQPGAHPVTVSQVGLLPIDGGDVTVSTSGEARLSLKERQGASLEVQVVDELGRPLPFARVELLGSEWPQVEGSVQRLDSFADHDGWRTFVRVPPRATQVRVRWGSRVETIVVDLLDGQTKRLPVTLAADPRAPR